MDTHISSSNRLTECLHAYCHRDKKDFQGRVARQGGVGGAQMKVTARNLRIREDTAKYLRNLDPNSAYYDPKTRAMRENPLPGTNPEEVTYAGDNYLRNTGDTIELARMQVFAIEAQDEKIDIHPEANPTAVSSHTMPFFCSGSRSS